MNCFKEQSLYEMLSFAGLFFERKQLLLSCHPQNELITCCLQTIHQSDRHYLFDFFFFFSNMLALMKDTGAVGIEVRTSFV